MSTDPISDMLTKIKNALAVKHNEVIIPFSKEKFSIVKILKAEGYIQDFSKDERGYGSIKIILKYIDGESVIKGMKRVSKPGQRIYLGFKDIPKTLGGLGITIVSTSRGLLTDREARKRKLGGEVVCQIW